MSQENIDPKTIPFRPTPRPRPGPASVSRRGVNLPRRSPSPELIVLTDSDDMSDIVPIQVPLTPRVPIFPKPISKLSIMSPIVQRGKSFTAEKMRKAAQDAGLDINGELLLLQDTGTMRCFI